jgi:alcohol dehydrogenase class IV
MPSSRTSSKQDLLNFINKKNYNKIFVISGKNSFYKSGAYKIIDSKKIDKEIKFYFKKSTFPEIKELIKITKILDSFKPKLIIAVGGGCVLDYAKIANIVDKNKINNLKKNIINLKSIGSKKKYPLIAIPTTAGSGAETTSNAVIYINKKKHSVENNLLLPSHFFLIVDFVINNSFKLKASSGFDVIAQSLESIISLKSNKKSLFYAKKSLVFSQKNYLCFLKKPTRANCSKMIIAANLAGKAINISKTGAPHAVSYPFTSLFGMDHGHAVSLTLENFLHYNYIHKHNVSSKFDLDKRYQLIFNVFKSNNIDDFVSKIRYLKKSAKLEDDYSNLGINIKKNIKKIMSRINTLRLKNNPIALNNNQIKNLILKN